MELLVSILLECKDLLILLVDKNVARKETNVFKVLLELKAIVVNEVNVECIGGASTNSTGGSVWWKKCFIMYHVSEDTSSNHRIVWRCGNAA